MKPDPMREALLRYMSAFGQALEAHGISFGPQQIEADKEAQAALAAPKLEQAPVAAAMKVIIDAMRADPAYAWSWHCNIAMAYFDAGGDRIVGNQGAERFMQILAGVGPAHPECYSAPLVPTMRPVVIPLDTASHLIAAKAILAAARAHQPPEPAKEWRKARSSKVPR